MSSKIDKLSTEEFAEIVRNSTSRNEALTKIGYSGHGPDVNENFRRKCLEDNIDITHFSKKRGRAISDEEVFTANSQVAQNVLRRRVLYREELPYECALCGQPPEIDGVELVLTLDHINGNNHDNRIENLRWLCPNCDSQQSTYCGGNVNWHA